VVADSLPPQGDSVRARLLTLGRQTFVYGLAGAASQAVGILTLPVFARVLTEAEYGVLEISIVGYAAVMVFADTGLTSGAQRNYYDYTEQQVDERRSALFTGLSSSLVVGSLIALALVLLAEPISHWAFDTDRYDSVIRVIALSVPTGTLVAFSLEAMRLTFKPWRYARCAFLAAMGGAVAGVIAVVGLDAGVEGVVLGTLIGSAFAACYGAFVSRRDLLGRFSGVQLRRMLSYGLPLVPAAVALWGLNFVDRVMLAKLGSLADTGQYAIANRFAFVPMLAVTAFTTAFGPFQLALWKDNAELEKQVRDRLLTYLTVALVTIGVVLAVFAREIVFLMAPSFTRAYQVVGLLVLSVAFWGIAGLVLFGIGLMRRTGYVALFTMLAASLNIALNFALIPPWGMIGAGCANLVAYVLLAVVYYWKSQQLYPTSYSLRRPATVLAAGALAMAVGVLPADPSLVTYGVKVATVGAFAVSLWAFGVIDEHELSELKALPAKMRALGARQR
jgi:O-antigen/teichoic acid export membrane protein